LANLLFQKPAEGAVESGWSWKSPIPSCVSSPKTDDDNDRQWEVHFEATSQKFILTPSSEGQIGIFPEQEQNWGWIFNTTKREVLWRAHNVAPSPPFRVLNGFAYTGGSTLAAAAGGKSASSSIALTTIPSATTTNTSAAAELVHLDAARSAITWAQQNAFVSNDLLGTRSIRWIEDDCLSFLEREIKREKKYDALVFDPPAFGRAARGKRFWKMDKDLETLVDMFPKLLSSDPAFILLSCHDVDWPHARLAALLSTVTSTLGVPGSLESGPMILTPKRFQGGNPLPLGGFARWTRKR